MKQLGSALLHFWASDKASVLGIAGFLCSSAGVAALAGLGFQNATITHIAAGAAIVSALLITPPQKGS